MTRLRARASTSRLTTRYPAKKTISTILAISAGWKLNDA